MTAPYTAEQALGLVLSHFETCWLSLHCCNGRSAHYPVKLLHTKRGDITVEQAMSRFKCKVCGNRPSSVYLEASHSIVADGDHTISARESYLISLTMIDEQNPTESDWLDQLAKALKLEPGLTRGSSDRTKRLIERAALHCLPLPP